MLSTEYRVQSTDYRVQITEGQGGYGFSSKPLIGNLYSTLSNPYSELSTP